MMARSTRRATNRPVSARTAKRRAAKVERATIAAKRESDQGPETMAQARAFDRKKKRYRRLGLCHPCAAQAALGHQLGFGKGRIHDPCAACQPKVASFPDPGPADSKWRKCLAKVEYLTKAEAREMGLI